MQIKLNPKQSVAYTTSATELLYGGAAGGGKSFLLRVSAIRWAMEIPGLQIYIFRRKTGELWQNHMEGPTSFPKLLAEHIRSHQVEYEAVKKKFRFFNGSTITLCHCQRQADVENYQGAEIHVLLIDELTHFTEYMYNYLRGRVRMIGLQIPEKYKSTLPRIETGSNPGSIGHAWVKRVFKPMECPLELRRMPVHDGGLLRQYIPARHDDNPDLMRDDPGYIPRLDGLGNPALVKAMKEGNWNIVAGQAFENLSISVHGVEPFAIPQTWMRYMSMDWGSSKPFSIGWWAVSDGTDPRFPRGALIRYREWYGWTGEVDTGCRMESWEVAAGILEREGKKERVRYRVADPSIFSRTDGLSIAEKMAGKGVIFRKADNERHQGYLELRERIKGKDDRPLLFAFTTCKQFWRTMLDLMMDENDLEDVDTDQEDHIYDEVRYACMSRPWVSSREAVSVKKDSWDRAFEREDEGDGDWRTA